MGIEKEKFRAYTLEEERAKKDDVFSVKLNEEERALLNQCKMAIRQPKDSTALKTLARIGAKVILSEPTSYVIETLFKNKRNNKRTGLQGFDIDSIQK